MYLSNKSDKALGGFWHVQRLLMLTDA